MKKALTSIFLLFSISMFSQEFYDFESGQQGWVIGTIAGANGWALRTQTGGCTPAALPTTWFGTPNDGSGCTDLNLEHSFIQSPVLTANSNEVSIIFDSYSANESGLFSYDNEHVEVRINGGAWTRIHNTISGLHNFCDSQFRNHTVSTSGYLTVNPGDDVEMRFKYNTVDGCCGCTNITGWFVDNVSVIGASSCNLSVNIAAPTSPIYYGYLPFSCTALQASATGANGAVTYSWSVDGDPNPDDEYATVCATSPDCIVVTVTAEDAAGCTAEATMLVEVVDVRCFTPSGQQKVELCHNEENNPKTICVSANAVADHLAHGDQLGACGEAPSCTPLLMQNYLDEQKRILDAKAVAVEKTVMGTTRPPVVLHNIDTENKRVNIYPNPASNMANIKFHQNLEGNVEISVYNQLGQMVLATRNEATDGVPVQLNIESLENGYYEVRLEFEHGSSFTEKLVVFKSK